MNRWMLRLSVVLMILTMFLQMSPAGNPTLVLGADGATGSITPGLFNAQYDTPITTIMESLTVSAAYSVGYGDGSGGTVASVFNFTTGSTQTTMTFTTSFDTTESSSGDIVSIGLWGQTDGNSAAALANALDFVEVLMTDLSDVFPTGFFIQLGVALIIVLIVAAIIGGLIKRGSS